MDRRTRSTLHISAAEAQVRWRDWTSHPGVTILALYTSPHDLFLGTVRIREGKVTRHGDWWERDSKYLEKFTRAFARWTEKFGREESRASCGYFCP